MNNINNSPNMTQSKKPFQYTFYKNPIFIFFISYISFIIYYYMNMNESEKKDFVYGNKFRNNNKEILFTDLYIYPYTGEGEDGEINVIIGIFKAPITWYLLTYLILSPFFVGFKNSNSLTYIRSIGFSYFLLLFLFIIHYIIYNYIINPKYVTIKSKLGDSRIIKNKHTYTNFYRVQWILLIYLSPILVFIYTYLLSTIMKIV